MKRLPVFCAALLLSAMPKPAEAETPDDAVPTHSVQCFLAVTRLLESQDPKVKITGAMASNFFAGQIFGAAPDIDLEKALRREATRLSDAELRGMLGQCGDEMQSRGAQISAAGKAIEANEPQRPAGPSS